MTHEELIKEAEETINTERELLKLKSDMELPDGILRLKDIDLIERLTEALKERGWRPIEAIELDQKGVDRATYALMKCTFGANDSALYSAEKFARCAIETYLKEVSYDR